MNYTYSTFNMRMLIMEYIVFLPFECIRHARSPSVSGADILADIRFTKLYLKNESGALYKVIGFSTDSQYL